MLTKQLYGPNPNLKLEDPVLKITSQLCNQSYKNLFVSMIPTVSSYNHCQILNYFT